MINKIYKFGGTAGLEFGGEHAVADERLVLAHNADVMIHQRQRAGRGGSGDAPGRADDCSYAG